jgi:uncharacterized protein (DUF2252 family)
MAARRVICPPKARATVLGERQRLKMARSAHAYVRGSTLKFYEWLASVKPRGLPEGPPVWICGDCHLGNLGPVANIKGRVKIAIRDFDQTVIGNPAHDLIRLALSLATAIRGSDLPGVTTALMLEEMIDGYESAMAAGGDGSPRNGSAPASVRRVLDQAIKRKWRHLAEERIKDVTPVIPPGKKFWPLATEEKKEIRRLFEKPSVRSMITSLRARDDDEPIEVLDAAYWVKGCSSLGRLRFAVLVQTGHKKKSFCLIDIKEAVPAAAPRSSRSRMPADHGARVVEGAKQLSPYLGQRMMAEHLRGRPVVMRELLPQDLKLEMDQLNREEAIGTARFLAFVVGQAHTAQMDAEARKEWRSILKSGRSKTLDAPSWLWTSVVHLVGVHESAYLEHCRTCALGDAAR